MAVQLLGPLVHRHRETAANDAAETPIMGKESEATMTPGPELDAAVLRILGWRNDSEWHVKFGYWTHPTNNGLHVHDSHLQLSTDHNGHEALRLCGPWFDEHVAGWEIKSYDGVDWCEATIIGGYHITTMRYSTRAEAICRLVLAIHERTTNPPRAT